MTGSPTSPTVLYNPQGKAFGIASAHGVRTFDPDETFVDERGNVVDGVTFFSQAPEFSGGKTG